MGSLKRQMQVICREQNISAQNIIDIRSELRQFHEEVC